MIGKVAALCDLARKRQETRWPGYKCIGDYFDGAYECDHVSPYTKAANNVDANVFILLQDWSSDQALGRSLDSDARDFGYTRSDPTNIRLERLLGTHFQLSLDRTYTTNLFPFVKMGNMSARIAVADLTRAANEFAVPQVEIVRPRLVICLGLSTYNALRRARGCRLVRSVSDAGETRFDIGGAEVWCQAHTGALGQINRNRGGIDRVSPDWERMARSFSGRLQH